MLMIIIITQYITTDLNRSAFILPDNRQIIFHGHDILYKTFPYLPNFTGQFDFEYSFVDQDYQFWKRNGFNFLRLSVMWPAVFPQRNQINYSYLQQVKQFVNKLGENGIYTLIDFHQDVISEYFCGEGVPDWSVPFEMNNTEQFPLPIIRVPYERDNITHKFGRQLCQSHPFGEYYMSSIVGKIFDCLYNSTCDPFNNASQPLQAAFLDFWGNVSDVLKDNQYVLGYDIMNEPNAGDLFNHPFNGTFISSKDYETLVLQPFYQSIIKRIMNYDLNHIIFYEPLVSNLSITGFTKYGPGMNIGIPPQQQAFTWHYYCMTIDKNGDPIQPKILCNAQDDFFWNMHNRQVNELGSVSLIGEFGAVPNDNISNSLIKRQMTRMSQKGLSWAYSMYKPYGDITTVFYTQQTRNEGLFNRDGSEQTSKVKCLTHPYVQIVSGYKLTNSEFDFDTEMLTIQFTTGIVGGVSEIFISEDHWNGFGYNFNIVIGNGFVDVERTDSKVLITNLVGGQVVEVTIW